MDGAISGSRPSTGAEPPPWQAPGSGAPVPWPSTPYPKGNSGPPNGLSKGLLAALAAAIAVVALTLGVLAGSVLTAPTGVSGTGQDAPAAVPEQPATTELEDAVESCAPSSEFIWIADEGRTIIAVGVGVQGAADNSVDQLLCILSWLDAPESLVAHISATRALDGTQEEDFGQYTAVWTYHPDSGLNMTIVRNK